MSNNGPALSVATFISFHEKRAHTKARQWPRQLRSAGEAIDTSSTLFSDCGLFARSPYESRFQVNSNILGNGRIWLLTSFPDNGRLAHREWRFLNRRNRRAIKTI